MIHKKVSSTKPDQDLRQYNFGTPEIRKQFIWELENIPKHEGGGKRIRLMSQPLDYFFKSKKKLINHRQYKAGRILARDFHVGGFLGNHKPAYLEPRVGGSRIVEQNQNQFDARKRFCAAMDYLKSNTSCALAYRVCCFDLYLADIKIDNYTSANQLMARLREVLDELADFYGLPKPKQATDK